MIIREGSIEEAFSVSAGIPEFNNPYPTPEYHRRAKDSPLLILIAEDSNAKLLGFKAGYFMANKSFYSWMGGVLPGYRRRGIALALAKKQEFILQQQGCQRIQMKTRPEHKAMIAFALSNGFKRVSPAGVTKENEIWLEKLL